MLGHMGMTNSVNPDQMPHVASDQGLRCLLFIQQFLDTPIGNIFTPSIGTPYLLNMS